MTDRNNSAEDSVAARSAARRRLIRGSFAAPAVLALHSGNAVAASSNFVRLSNELQKNAATSPTIFSGGSPTDRYIRVRLSSLRPSSTGTSPRWYVVGSKLDLLTAGKAVIRNDFVQPNEWWQYDPVNQKTMGLKLTTKPQWSSGNPGVWADDGAWVAVRFTVVGSVVSISSIVGCSYGGGSVANTSAWTSFVLTA